MTTVFRRELNVPATLAGSTGTTTVNRVACNTTHNVGSFVVVALNANMNDNVIVGNRVICNRSNFTNRLKRIVTHHSNHVYNYNHGNYLRACYSTAKMTHATHRFLTTHASTDLLHGVPTRDVASGSMCSTTMRKSGLTRRVFRFAKGVLNRTLTSTVTFSDPRTVMLFKNLTGSNSCVVGPVVGSVSSGMLGVCGNGAGLLISRLGSSSTTMLNTDTLT